MTAPMDIVPIPVTVTDPGYVPAEAITAVPYKSTASAVTTSYVEAFAVGVAGAGAIMLCLDNTDTSDMYVSIEGSSPTHFLICPGQSSRTFDLGFNGREISSQIMVKRFGTAGSGNFYIQIVK